MSSSCGWRSRAARSQAADARDVDAFVARRRAQLTEGEYRPLDIRLSDGRVVEIKARRTRRGGWIALWSDVTYARHAQARLEDAVALSADAFAFFDHDDVLAMCNDAYAAFYGRAHASEIIGKRFADLITHAYDSHLLAAGEDRQAWIARRLEAHRAPAGVMTVELANGEAYLMRDRLTGEGGRVVVFTDVTDRRRAETALEEQTRALAETRSAAAAQADYLADLTRRFDEAVGQRRHHQDDADAHHEPRAQDAAQRHHRLLRPDAHDGRPLHARAGEGICRPDP